MMMDAADPDMYVPGLHALLKNTNTTPSPIFKGTGVSKPRVIHTISLGNSGLRQRTGT
jgi:hypothetical protein